MNSQHCSNCNSENRTEARFCKRCGSWLLAKCPFCNSTLPEAALFCDQCGRALNPQVASTSPAPNPQPHSPAVTSPSHQESPTPSSFLRKEPQSPSRGSTVGTSELHQYIPEELMKKLQVAREKGG